MVPKQCQQQNDRQRHAKQPKQSTFSKIHSYPPPKAGRRWRTAKVPSAKSWSGSTECGAPHRRATRGTSSDSTWFGAHRSQGTKKGPSAGGDAEAVCGGVSWGTIRHNNEHKDGSFPIGANFFRRTAIGPSGTNGLAPRLLARQELVDWRICAICA